MPPLTTQVANFCLTRVEMSDSMSERSSSSALVKVTGGKASLAAQSAYSSATCLWRRAARGSGRTTVVKSLAVIALGPPGATFWRRSPADSPSAAGICSSSPSAL